MHIKILILFFRPILHKCKCNLMNPIQRTFLCNVLFQSCWQLLNLTVQKIHFMFKHFVKSCKHTVLVVAYQFEYMPYLILWASLTASNTSLVLSINLSSSPAVFLSHVPSICHAIYASPTTSR